MSRLPEHIRIRLRNATETTRNEVEQFCSGLTTESADLRGLLSPSTHQIDRLAAGSLNDVKHSSIYTFTPTALALTVIAILAMIVPMTTAFLPGSTSAPDTAVVQYGAPSIPLQTMVDLTDVAVAHLGPSIDVSGDALVRLERADNTGTVVHVEQGNSHFDVDPTGEYRSLLVVADDVEVRVMGTVFDVRKLPNNIAVSVERGRVSVRHLSLIHI